LHAQILCLAALGIAAGCSCSELGSQGISADASSAAKTLFEETSKQFHIPSADANGPERLRLQEQSINGYHQLLRQYPREEYWAAQALRSMGNIYATQTNLDLALMHFARVEKCYPKQRWQVLMAWKSAADLLWDADRRAEAQQFYAKIVYNFDSPDAAQIIKMVVRGSRLRLNSDPPGSTSG
jgi:tetratricopeptide (TPR) repeat protein